MVHLASVQCMETSPMIRELIRSRNFGSRDPHPMPFCFFHLAFSIVYNSPTFTMYTCNDTQPLSVDPEITWAAICSGLWTGVEGRCFSALVGFYLGHWESGRLVTPMEIMISFGSMGPADPPSAPESFRQTAKAACGSRAHPEIGRA